jgi:hypothetical protein
MCFGQTVYAQHDSLPKFDFSGYAELYLQ